MFRKTLAIAALLASTAVASTASAGSITVSGSSLDFGAGVAQTIKIAQYNGAAPLLSVIVELNGHIDGTITIINGQTFDQKVSYAMVGGPTPLSNVAITGPIAPLSVFMTDPGGSVVVAGNPSPFATQIVTVSDADTASTAGAPLAAYIGAGTVDFTAIASALYQCSGGDITCNFVTAADAFIHVTYNFDDGERVPVPATLALLGAGLVGLGAMRRRA